IGAMAAALCGRVDAIGLTGSLAKSNKTIEFIKERISFVAPVYLYPGENEMEALALGALRYAYGVENASIYK
ncbi:MAG: butyrate kinase, partial [Lutispora sp.]